MDILPIKALDSQDIPIFGDLNVNLGRLARTNLPVSKGIVVSPPQFRLQTSLEHFDFRNKDVFEQALTLIQRDIEKIPIPGLLLKELKDSKKFWVLNSQLNSPKEVWTILLKSWLEQIKQRIWKDGFYPGVTRGLNPEIIIFVKKVSGFGLAYFDPLQQDVVIEIKGEKIHPDEQKIIVELVSKANKKLFIPHIFEWIVDGGVKITRIMPYTPLITPETDSCKLQPDTLVRKESRCAMKVFADFSKGLTVEAEIDGSFLASEQIYNLEKPLESFDSLVMKLVELSTAFPQKPVLVKLADLKEGMGGIRGALRLLHQKSLLEPILSAISFVLEKKQLNNIGIVLPFARNSGEILLLKREMAVKKLSRRNSLKCWIEIAVPENIINLEDYLMTGIDGVVINLDELLSHLTGFDLGKEELHFYKKEISALLKFLDEPFRILHKSNLPVLACGSLIQQTEILEFLIEKGAFGIIVEKPDSLSMKDILYQLEKRVILRRAV